MMNAAKVGVFGANGHTGRFVATELKRRGIACRVIGRDPAALQSLLREIDCEEMAVAQVDDPASLRTAFEGLSVVINCAGPFFDTARPVIEAALNAGCHVLDVTAEQVTVLDTISSFDEQAKQAGCVVIPAMAFFGGLADLLATSLTYDWPEIDEIETAVALSFWHPTAGTRKTGERNTATRLMIRARQLRPVPPQPLTSAWDFPEPFGQQPVTSVMMSEIILMSRHLAVKSATSWMTLKPLTDLGDAETPIPTAIDHQGRSDQRFVMSVRATSAGAVRQTTVFGQDIYAVTAPLVVEACSRLIEGVSPTLYGVRAPGEIFDAGRFLHELRGIFRSE